MKSSRKKTNLLLLFVLLSLGTILSACSAVQRQENQEKPSDLPKTKVTDIHVAVVGEMPNIKVDKKKVKLIPASLDNLIQEGSLPYDAVLVMENKLKDAANEKYKDLYFESGIPIFFVKSEASHLPFIDYDLTYDEYVNRIDDQDNFIVGILKEEGKDRMKGWKFPYPVVESKMLKGEEDTEQIYNNLFNTIAKISTE